MFVAGGVLATAAVADSSDYGANGVSCAYAHPLCTEVLNKRPVFGNIYVGHDEPSLLFYSDKPGSGNEMSYTLTLPKDPPSNPIVGRSYNFELHPAFWFGIAMCDTQSYPEQVRNCAPDSNSNITPLARHPGSAYMEFQLYPPGYVKQWTGFSCSATQYCAALTIDSLAEDPVNGTTLNSSCAAKIGGLEYVNFAYLTHSGIPQGPPNPLYFRPGESGTPRGTVVMFNPGDTLKITMHDTPDGLLTMVDDLTTGQTGFMTASAANGFGQIKYQPTGDGCTEIPYNFHPMYSTSTKQTTVPWAAHTYNVAFSDEIGHFDWCSQVDTSNGTCAGLEGEPGIDQEWWDYDDVGCFPDSAATLYPVAGCVGSNDPGFDGASYMPDWPDGNTYLHPTPIVITSPLTGPNYNQNYAQSAFEVDTPAIEPDSHCNQNTGAGCTLLPYTDEKVPVTFYPFYSDTGGPSCRWLFGNDVPGLTVNDFGKDSQYGTLQEQHYLVYGGHGAIAAAYETYNGTLPSNPCPATG
jgi:hypothetical protein